MADLLSIFVDDREHALISCLEASAGERSADTSSFIRHLPVGDIWIGVKGEESVTNICPNGIVCERKTVADLEASILDNRYREQRSRLISFCTEHKAHPCYIIEGSLDRSGRSVSSVPKPTFGEIGEAKKKAKSTEGQSQDQGKGHERLAKKALLKHLTRLSFRYHISVFLTKSVEETAELCQIMAEQFKADPTTFEMPAQMTYIETRGKTRQENTDDPRTFACSVLMCCRGVSAAGAQAILDGCGGTLEGVWKATSEELAAILLGKRKLGKAVAGRLHSLLHSVPNILSASSTS